MTRRLPRLTLRAAPKATRRLRVESLEDRTVPSFTVAKSFPVGPNGGTGIKPVSVAVGDFNGDGNLDAVTAIQDSFNTIKMVSVVLGNGDGTFQAPANIDIGRQPSFVQATDVNGDGKLDLLTANKADNSVSVLLGNGNGTFQSAATFAVGANTGPVALDVADFNGDSKLDLAVANNGASFVTLMLGNGTGGFTASAQTVPVGTNPTSVAVADFNKDGKPDIATVSGGFGHLNINLNTGAGTFGPTANFETGFCANGVTVGDFNHDGKADVAVACVFPSSDGVSVLLGNGNGTFVTHPDQFGNPIPFVSYNAGNQTPGYITTGDLDGDGNADLVSANFSSTIQFANNSITVLPGKANGTFGPARIYYGGAGPLGVAVGDFNEDGKADVVTADGGGSVGTVSMLLGRGDGTLKASQGLAVSQPGPAVGADFTGDGKPDLAVTMSEGLYNGVVVFKNLGDGRFGPGVKSADVSGASSVAAADFNGDGRPDLAVTGWQGVSILLNNGAGSFGNPTAYAAGGINNWVSVGDFNKDGKRDLAVGYSTGMSVLLGNGNGTFKAASPVTAGGGVDHIAVADLNGDTFPDLAVVNTTKVTVALGNGDGTFGTAVSLDAGTPDSVSVGDFNGDGAPDLAATSFIPPGGGGSAVLVWLNDGFGGFGTMTKYLVESNPIGSAVADFNQDGKLDIVAANDFADTLSLLSGTGTGTFNPHKTFVVGDRPTWVATADFSGDGRPDVAVVNSNSGSVTLVSTPKPVIHGSLAAPTSATAGTAIDVTVTAQDENGDPVLNYTGTVHFTSTDPQAVLPVDYTFTPADGGSKTFTVTLKTAGTRTVTVTGGFGTLSDSVQVDPAAGDRIQVTAPTGATAGTPFNVTVRATDPYGNVVAGFTGTVQFAATDPIGTVPADYTFVGADQGTHTFQVTLKRAGAQAVSVTSAGLTGPQPAAIQVTAGAATKLAFVNQPVNTFRYAAIPAPVTLQIQDQFDNLVTGRSPITLSLASNHTRAMLGGVRVAFPDANGMVSFTKVWVTKPGTYTLAASSGSGTSPESNSFTVYAATHFRVSVTSPVPKPTAGDTVTVTVTALDALNRPDPTYEGTIHFTSTDLQAVLPADYPFTAADNGQHSFEVTLKTSGLRRVVAYDTNRISVRGRVGMTVIADAATQFTVTAFPLLAKANRWYDFVVTARDQFGNRAKGYLGTVTISTTGSATIAGAGPTAPAPVTYTFKPLQYGRHVFSAKFTAPGTPLSLTVTDQADATITGSETGITVV